MPQQLTSRFPKISFKSTLGINVPLFPGVLGPNLRVKLWDSRQNIVVRLGYHVPGNDITQGGANFQGCYHALGR